MSQELLTIPADVLQSQQQNGTAAERTSAYQSDETRLLDDLRRAHLAAARAIEKYLAKVAARN